MNPFQDPNEIVYADEPDDGGESYVFDASSLAQPQAQQYQPQIRHDPLMFEAQRRMRKASYYQTFLDGPLLEGVGNDPVAAEVEREFKTFVVQKYQELLGINTPKPPEKTLSDEEVTILKEFVQTIKARKGQTQRQPQPQFVAQAPQPPPVVPVQVQPVPQPPPIQAPAVPKVRRRRIAQSQEAAVPQVQQQRPNKKQKRPILPNGQVAPDLTGTNIHPAPPMTVQMQEIGMQIHAKQGNQVLQEFDPNGRAVGGTPK